MRRLRHGVGLLDLMAGLEAVVDQDRDPTIDPPLERDPGLDLEIREALLEALRERQVHMTDQGLAAVSGYRLDWVRDVLLLLAFEGKVVIAYHTAGHWFETEVRLPSPYPWH
jgi:hypothetical protein